MNSKYKDRNAEYCKRYYDKLKHSPLSYSRLLEKKREHWRKSRSRNGLKISLAETTPGSVAESVAESVNQPANNPAETAISEPSGSPADGSRIPRHFVRPKGSLGSQGIHKRGGSSEGSQTQREVLLPPDAGQAQVEEGEQDHDDLIEKRAAIIECDGGLSSDKAKRKDLQEVLGESAAAFVEDEFESRSDRPQIHLENWAQPYSCSKEFKQKVHREAEDIACELGVSAEQSLGMALEKLLSQLDGNDS